MMRMNLTITNEDNDDNDDKDDERNENKEKADAHQADEDDDDAYHDASATPEQLHTRRYKGETGDGQGHEDGDEDEVLFEGRRRIAIPR